MTTTSSADPANSRTAWAETGVEQVADDIYRIPLPLDNDALRAVNAYAVVGADGVTMIDAGLSTDQSAAALADGLEAIDLQILDISRFLITHAHRDHYTQAVAVRRRFGTNVSVGIGERPTLEWLSRERSGDDQPSYVALMRRAGARSLLDASLRRGDGFEPSAYEWALPDEWLTDRAVVELGSRQLEVIATPGHTAGHVVFHDRSAAELFAGDHVLPHITPSIGLEPVPTCYPLRDYIDSLRLTLSLPDARLLPAHGWVTGSAHDRVHELLSHHEKRLAVIGRLAAADESTAFDVATKVSWTRHEHHLSDMALFHQRLAVSETLAHLDVLVLRGLLAVRTGEDGTDFFCATPDQ